MLTNFTEEDLEAPPSLYILMFTLPAPTTNIVVLLLLAFPALAVRAQHLREGALSVRRDGLLGAGGAKFGMRRASFSRSQFSGVRTRLTPDTLAQIRILACHPCELLLDSTNQDGNADFLFLPLGTRTVATRTMAVKLNGCDILNSPSIVPNGAWRNNLPPAGVGGLLCTCSKLAGRACASGGVTARALAFHKGEPGSIPGGVAPGFLHVGIVPDDAARWSSGFIGDLPFIPPLHSGAAPCSPHFALTGSRTAQITPLLVRTCLFVFYLVSRIYLSKYWNGSLVQMIAASFPDLYYDPGYVSISCAFGILPRRLRDHLHHRHNRGLIAVLPSGMSSHGNTISLASLTASTCRRERFPQGLQHAEFQRLPVQKMKKSLGRSQTEQESATTCIKKTSRDSIAAIIEYHGKPQLEQLD
ncbi:hypothetical protein PR048_000609 [Dryococelus australis]|uniref:Uncharacterized protein n=1 Tax=Dryococelus australis TaxID=614101 RepID=A0ABQ9IGC8_9NEOP|nr:hypothetical protein PR048_000609 [Dryococelus australis]